MTPRLFPDSPVGRRSISLQEVKHAWFLKNKLKTSALKGRGHQGGALLLWAPVQGVRTVVTRPRSRCRCPGHPRTEGVSFLAVCPSLGPAGQGGHQPAPCVTVAALRGAGPALGVVGAAQDRCSPRARLGHPQAAVRSLEAQEKRGLTEERRSEMVHLTPKRRAVQQRRNTSGPRCPPPRTRLCRGWAWALRKAPRQSRPRTRRGTRVQSR